MNDSCPPYVTIGMLVELLPDRHEITVYRYNGPKGGKKRLPEPDLQLGSVSMWTVPTIQEWAERNKLTLDAEILDRFCQSQRLS